MVTLLLLVLTSDHGRSCSLFVEPFHHKNQIKPREGGGNSFMPAKSFDQSASRSIVKVGRSLTNKLLFSGRN